MAAATALWQDEAHVVANRALYREKFDLAERRLAAGSAIYRPDGGFFLWLEVGDGEAAARRAVGARPRCKVLPGGLSRPARCERPQSRRRARSGSPWCMTSRPPRAALRRLVGDWAETGRTTEDLRAMAAVLQTAPIGAAFRSSSPARAARRSASAC